MAAATSNTANLKGAIVTARNVIQAALADAMKAAALAAIEKADFQALAAEAIDGIDLGDAEALAENAAEILGGHDWEMSL